MAMNPLLYDELVPFYHLLDPLEDHADEAGPFGDLILEAVPGARTLLELGAGAGNNAYYLKERFELVLTDLSPAMLALSRAKNPGVEHHVGDMRTLRMGRTFDAVLIHDAICYMRTDDELRAALQTAFEHTRPGGVALFVPDCLTESFFEASDDHAADDDGASAGPARGLRVIEWMWDPDPRDTEYLVDYAFLLREGGEVRAVHDRHVEGLFPRERWHTLLREVGFASVREARRDVSEEPTPYTDTMFLASRA